MFGSYSQALSKDEGQKISPRNSSGLANSKTNHSSSNSLCDEPLWRHMGHVLVYVPERAIRQVQKNVCPHFHYNVPEEEEDGLRQGKTGTMTRLNPGSCTFYHTTAAWGEAES